MTTRSVQDHREPPSSHAPLLGWTRRSAAIVVAGGALIGGLGVQPASGAVAPTASAWPATRIAVPDGAQAGGARIAYGGEGTTLVDWATAATAPDTAVASSVLTIGPDGTRRPVVALPWSIAAPPVVDGNGAGLLLGGPKSTFTRRGLGWASVTSGAVGPWQKLTTANVVGDPSLSVNRRGDAVAVWVEERGESRRVRAAVRPAGKRFRAPVTLVPFVADSSEHLASVASAVASNGRVLVAVSGLVAGSRVAAWVGTVKVGFGGRLAVGSQENSSNVGTTITTDGRALVVWGSQRAGIEAHSPWVVRAASLERGAQKFGRVQTVDRGGIEAFRHGPVRVVRGPKGTATAAWGTAGEMSGSVRVAASTRTGRFGAFDDIAGSSSFSGLDVRSDGVAVVTWQSVSSTPSPLGGAFTFYTLGAALRPAGGSFGAVESLGSADVAAFGPSFGHALAKPAFNPRTGRPSVAVVVHDGPGTPPVLEIRTR